MTQTSATYDMRLANLLEGFVFIDDAKNPLIKGLAMDSREVFAGCLFFACRSVNQHEHGSTHIDAAIAAGAVAIAVDINPGELSGELFTEQRRSSANDRVIPLFLIEQLDQKLGLIADRFYRHPSQDLNVIGITGTNGKTSCAQFLAQCLQVAERKCGLIGTLGAGLWGQLNTSRFTTPLALGLQNILSDIRDAGATHAVMEVSSHALQQGRANGVDFNIAILTNLTRDHLDYHGDMESYARAKKKLFEVDSLQWIILNTDDSFGRQLLREIPRHATKVVYGLQRERMAHHAYFVSAEIQRLDLHGMRFRVTTSWGDGVVESKLLGRFNINNLLAVLAALLCLGMSIDEAISHIQQLEPPAGRMEKFSAKDDSKPLVVVDYSHTPDALEQVLMTLREHCAGEMWLVFGCGGDRDVGKRPQMGAIAEKFATRVIVTEDNPRTEDQQQITDDILRGFVHPKNAIVLHDRKKAILMAINQAAVNDIVLVAGKGHENYQLVGDLRISYSDRKMVASILEDAA